MYHVFFVFASVDEQLDFFPHLIVNNNDHVSAIICDILISDHRVTWQFYIYVFFGRIAVLLPTDLTPFYIVINSVQDSKFSTSSSTVIICYFVDYVMLIIVRQYHCLFLFIFTDH